MLILPGVTLLICTYNGASLLPATLRHVAAQQLPPGLAWEVVLISNASTDDTLTSTPKLWAELGSPAPLRVLNEPRAGKTYALERGFLEARYSYVCILDDDNWLAPDYLALGYEVMERNPKIGALGGEVLGVCETPPPAWFADFAGHYAIGAQDPELAAGDITERQGHVAGAGCMVRKAAWERVLAAGFKSLMVKYPGVRVSGEDIEMCHALTLAGYRIWFDSRMRFQHFISTSRLNWGYLCSLYKSNAMSDVDLRPYQHFMQRATARGAFLWLRNGLYIGRFMLKSNWLVWRTGHWRSPLAAVGNREVLKAAFYRWKVQHYLAKEWRGDQGFEQVKAFIERLRALPDENE